jgi:hypothetical protein
MHEGQGLLAQPPGNGHLRGVLGQGQPLAAASPSRDGSSKDETAVLSRRNATVGARCTTKSLNIRYI